MALYTSLLWQQPLRIYKWPELLLIRLEMNIFVFRRFWTSNCNLCAGFNKYICLFSQQNTNNQLALLDTQHSDMQTVIFMFFFFFFLFKKQFYFQIFVMKLAEAQWQSVSAGPWCFLFIYFRFCVCVCVFRMPFGGW